MDSLSTLCYLIIKPTHALARKYFYIQCICVCVYLCVYIFECISTLCVGGDVLGKMLVLLWSTAHTKMMILMQGYLTFEKDWLTLLLHTAGFYTITISAELNSLVFYSAHKDSLNNDGKSATGAGNRVKKNLLAGSKGLERQKSPLHVFKHSYYWQFPATPGAELSLHWLHQGLMWPQCA